MSILIFISVTALGLFLLVGLPLILVYNKLVRHRAAVRSSWAQIDTELIRRHDLVPNLVQTVRNAANFESSVLEEVTQARNTAVSTEGAGVDAQQGAEQNLSRALNRLFALAEAYPQLTATQNYIELQRQLATTEDRIAATRGLYNLSVEKYNALRISFPTILVGGMLGFQQQEPYFAIDAGDPARTPPVIKAETP